MLLLKLSIASMDHPHSETTSSSTPTTTATSSAELPSPPVSAAELQGLNKLACGVCGSTLMLADRPLQENVDPADQVQHLSLACASTKGAATAAGSDVAEALSGQHDKSEASITTPPSQISPNHGTSTSSKRIQRIVDLPSEHWQELVECWMCHDEEDIKELREGDLGAREGQVLVGTTYLLIHALDINQEAIQIHPDAKEVDWTRGIKRRWRPLVCSCCLHSVGEGWYHSRNEDSSDIELLQVKLHKYGVQYIGQDSKDPRRPWSIPRQRYVPYLLAEIFESMRHHASYRFILEDRLSGKDLMLLWVLNWDATIITNQRPKIDSSLTWFGSMGADIEELQQMDGPRKVVKVLYLTAPSDNSETSLEGDAPLGNSTTTTSAIDSKEEAVWKRWRADHAVEHVQVLPAMALGVRLLLEQSSHLLPPNQSKVSMDNMRVGWFLL
ncbi:hypothetical protein DFQ27_003254 [Actinomortierella ambigua]|uniref:Uncharacterized protein n=1 Tax=Actinomortierella ambigua TaxID=1343610 RepID=A0A9P6U659_9FUNG|nr:hypothetical protein DFQ27_003254 [Actinomortierella ambigua]